MRWSVNSELAVMFGSPGCCSGRDQLPPVMSDQRDLDNDAGLERRVEADLGEMLGAAAVARFHEHASRSSDLGLEMARQCRRAFLTQAPSAFLDDVAPHLR